MQIDGEDAIEFWENEKKKPTKGQIEMFKEAKKLYDRIKF